MVKGGDEEQKGKEQEGRNTWEKPMMRAFSRTVHVSKVPYLY